MIEVGTKTLTYFEFAIFCAGMATMAGLILWVIVFDVHRMLRRRAMTQQEWIAGRDEIFDHMHLVLLPILMFMVTMMVAGNLYEGGYVIFPELVWLFGIILPIAMLVGGSVYLFRKGVREHRSWEAQERAGLDRAAEKVRMRSVPHEHRWVVYVTYRECMVCGINDPVARVMVIQTTAGIERRQVFLSELPEEERARTQIVTGTAWPNVWNQPPEVPEPAQQQEPEKKKIRIIHVKGRSGA